MIHYSVLFVKPFLKRCDCLHETRRAACSIYHNLWSVPRVMLSWSLSGAGGRARRGRGGPRGPALLIDRRPFGHGKAGAQPTRARRLAMGWALLISYPARVSRHAPQWTSGMRFLAAPGHWYAMQIGRISFHLSQELTGARSCLSPSQCPQLSVQRRGGLPQV